MSIEHKIREMSKIKCQECVKSHISEGDNYSWLELLGHGKVMKVFFEEPVGSGKWILYDDHWWEVHCNVIDHGDNLYNSHMKAFVLPGRFARLLFVFEDLVQMEPDDLFYRLEVEYFRNKQYCQ